MENDNQPNDRNERKNIITIKRYSNRKLYDTSQSRYITLAELGELIRRGENIEVIDNDTKADLTEMTLTQVLMTQQKQKQKGIRNLVQSQAEILLQRISVPMQQIRDEALRQVEKQVEKFKRRADPASMDDSLHPHGNPEAAAETPAQEPASPSLNLKLESLKTSSDEKLLSLLLVQRLEQLEEEVRDLKRRLELLEQKDDDTY
jgi:polyhydroxyalkanoate synthesis repressor PhaR